VYVPAVLVDGVIAPVVGLIVNPEVELNVPPAIPVLVHGCAVATDLQNADAVYEIAAVPATIEIVVEVLNAAQPADAGIL
jgi:hypothetical protein